MKIIIDRFEGDYVVCEQPDGTMIDIKKERLPKESKEGDVLNYTDDKITMDSNETKQRSERIKNLMDSLWND